MVDRPASSRARRALAVLLTAGGLVVTGAGGLTAAPADAATGAVPTTVPAAAPGTSVPRAAEAEAEQTPLRVTLNGLNPGYVPASGPIRITGTVTNDDDETWSTVKVYATDGTDVAPMQSPAEIQAAIKLPTDAYIGDRILYEGRTDEIAELAPGESRTFRVVVPSSALDVTQGGVYWFGVHALGSSPSTPFDLLADGRARTLLPYVPDRISTGLPTSLVVPLTRPLPYAADGSLTELAQWSRSLSPGGRLHDVVDAAAADPGDLTWVVDPALLDAVARLARGNPPRSLDPTRPPQAGGADGVPGGEAAVVLESDVDGDGVPDLPGGDDQDADEEQPTVSPDDARLAELAQDWLRSTRRVLGAGQVMVLPYGNLDVPAALQHRPALVDLARAQQSRVLQAWGIDTSPVTTGPVGSLDAATVQDVSERDRSGTVLLDDEGLGLSRPPAVASVDGDRVVVASAGVAQGGSTSGPAPTTISLRQRVLAEAAVRVIRSDRQALVAPLPIEWSPGDDGEELLLGLQDVPWLDLDRLDPLVAGATPVAVDAARLPGGSEHASDSDSGTRPAPLTSETVAGVSSLIRAGDTLQNLLADNTLVAGTVTQEALTHASYAARTRQPASRLATASARSWIQDRLDAVQVSAPRGVTLSSESGRFSTTLTNDLDQPVVVRLQVRGDPEVTVTVPDTVQVAPRSRTTVVLDARASDSAVHRITLQVTDVTGRALGSSEVLPIRYAQVSGIIWLFIGVGVGILFLAIVLRLVRRVRRSRRAAAGFGPEGPGSLDGSDRSSPARSTSPDPVR